MDRIRMLPLKILQRIKRLRWFAPRRARKMATVMPADASCYFEGNGMAFDRYGNVIGW